MLVKYISLNAVTSIIEKLFFVGLSAVLARALTSEEFGGYQALILTASFASVLIGATVPYICSDLGDERLSVLRGGGIFGCLAILPFLLLYFSFGVGGGWWEAVVYSIYASTLPLVVISKQVAITVDKQGLINKLTILINAGAFVAIATMVASNELLLINIALLLGGVNILYSAHWLHPFSVRHLKEFVGLKIWRTSKLSYTAAFVMLGFLFDQFDQFFVMLFYSKEKFALYKVATYKIPLIDIVVGSMSAVLVARFSVDYINSREEALRHLHLVTERLMKILLPTILCAAIFSEELIFLLFGDGYTSSWLLYSIFNLKYVLSFLATIPLLIVLGQQRILVRFLVGALLVEMLVFGVIFRYGSLFETMVTHFCFHYIYVGYQIKLLAKNGIYPSDLFGRLLFGRVFIGALVAAGLLKLALVSAPN